MWLLSTSRAELCHFSDANSVDRGYAILSHTWGDSEQTFQDVEEINRRCGETGENPRDHVSPKIRNCCILAEGHGYRWVWIDSCCINKMSSTELSEAINSMFRWYEQAEVCYAFLEDVPNDCVLEANDSEFRMSRWHTRGWTLQELIAPNIVIFVSMDWKLLGNKTDLAPLLEDITRVWASVLTRQVDFAYPSIAARMSWAAIRNTTRVEDEAYCLMGLFGVNMPTIYGEGRQAFKRLQMEIMHHSVDTSLFAWGAWLSQEECEEFARHEDETMQSVPWLDTIQYLLAASSSEFTSNLHYLPYLTVPIQPYLPAQWYRLKRMPPAEAEKLPGPFGTIELPRFSITNYGVECRFPVIETDGLTIAVLLCQGYGEHFGLLLHKSGSPFEDPSRPLYYVTASFRNTHGLFTRVRMLSLGPDLYNLRVFGKTVKAEWRTIHIGYLPPTADAMSTPFALLNCSIGSFRIPHWLMTKFVVAGFRMYQVSADSDMGTVSVRTQFYNWTAGETIYLDLGECTVASGSPALWANIFLDYGMGVSLPLPPISHDCTMHHIDSWDRRAKSFGTSGRVARLSFTSDLLHLEAHVVVHIELSGHIYEEMFRATKVVIPPSDT